MTANMMSCFRPRSSNPVSIFPTANTLIVHRADMFGLGQLYQLRGRVGRSKVRAYALFTVPADRTMTPQAETAAESAAFARYARRRVSAREP